MVKIKIQGYKRKGFIKDVKKGSGIRMKYISPTKVRGHMRKDTGKPGKTREEDKWFEPGRHTGWSKDEPQKKRINTIMLSQSKSLTPHNRTLRAFRQLNSLANVTTDKSTEIEARKDAAILRRRL